VQCNKAAKHTSPAKCAELEEILVSEEEHVNWLEAQLSLIGQVGEAQYLAQQIHS